MTAVWRPPAFRSPEHGGHEGGSPVSWTELFYDLVFVVAIANLGRRFLHHPSPDAAIEFVVLFGMLWWAWASITFLVDRYESNDAVERLLAVTQMLGIAGLAAAFAVEGDLDSISRAVAASYALTRVVIIAMYARAWWHLESSRPLVTGYLRGFTLDTSCWLVSVITPPPVRYVLWAIAMITSLATPWLMRRTQARSPLSTSHLPERFGLFTILVLGECIAAVVAGLHIESAMGIVFGPAGPGLLVATGLWWLYFDNFEGSVVRRDPNRVHDWRPTTWIYSHFPLVVAIATVGDGIGHLASGAEGDTGGLIALCGLSLAAALLTMALILASTAGNDARRRARRGIARVLGAAVVAALGLILRDRAPLIALSAFAAVLVVEVLFDLLDDVLTPSAVES